MAMISYVPPGVYTETKFQPPLPLPAGIFRTPLFIGTGNEQLVKTVTVTRGSNSGSLQVGEEYRSDSFVYADPDNTDQFITEQSTDGILRVFQTRYYPIVRDDGSQEPTDNRSDVSVTVNGVPAVVEAVDGINGLVKLVNAPLAGDSVRCSYRFARTDTFVSKESLTSQIKGKYQLVLPKTVKSSDSSSDLDLIKLLNTFTVFETGVQGGFNIASITKPWLKKQILAAILASGVTGLAVSDDLQISSINADFPLATNNPLTVSSTGNVLSADTSNKKLVILPASPAPTILQGTHSLTITLKDVVATGTGSGADVIRNIVINFVSLPAGSSPVTVGGIVNYLNSFYAADKFSTRQVVLSDGSDYILVESIYPFEIKYTTPSVGTVGAPGFIQAQSFTITAETLGNSEFYTRNNPLRNGLSDGRYASAKDIKVYVNESEEPIVNTVADVYYEFDAKSGKITFTDKFFDSLVAANKPFTSLEVSYFFNRYGDYWDYLPDSGVIEILSCGRIASRNEYENGADFVLVNNPKDSDRIVWGNAATVKENLFSGQTKDILTSKTSGYIPFDSRQTTVGLLEYTMAYEEALPSSSSPYVYSLKNPATIGDTTGDLVSDYISKLDGSDDFLNILKVRFAANPLEAQGSAATPGIVSKCEMVNGKFYLTLETLPALNQKVYVTYNYSKFVDMKYVLAKTTDEYFQAFYSADEVTTTPVLAVTSPVLATDSNVELGFIDNTTRLTPRFEAMPSVPFSDYLKESYYLIKFKTSSTTEFEVFKATLDSSGTYSPDGNMLGSGVAGQSCQVKNLTFAIPPATVAAAEYVFSVTPYFQVGVDHAASFSGLELSISDLLNVKVGDSALLESYEKSGKEPNLGATYWVTYSYEKKDYSSKMFSKLSDVVTEYGAATPENPVSLAASLAFANGAGSIAIKQVQKDPGLKTASFSKYLEAITDVEGDMANGYPPAYIVPLIGATPDLLSLLSDHCDEQSSVLYRSERNSLVGVPAGVLPEEVGLLAEGIASSRVRIVYPDSMLLTTVSSLGKKTQHLVDGYYMAAALAGRVCAKGTDAATPWDRKPILGFDSLGRKMNRVQMDNVAKYGITVIEPVVEGLVVRHGLTTDITNVLTRNPTVTQIVDEIHQRTRAALDPFIGAKFVPSIVTDINEKFTGMLSNAKTQQIIKDFKEIVVQPSEDDPQAVEVSVFIAPVLPLLYINVKFTMRVSL